MSKLRENTFLNDLYRDLRDRRLLIPLALLLVAIVAVPFALGGGSSAPEAPLAPAAAGSGDEAAAVQPAVLAESAGIRNYRQRLSALKQRNPFEQQFALPSPKDVALQDSPTETSTSSTSSTSSSTTPSLAPTSATDTSSSSSTSTTAPSTSTTDTSPVPLSSGAGPAHEPKPEIRFYAARVDVTIGPLGDTKRLEGVKPLDLLPDAEAPVVTFVGLASAHKALFSVSRDVTETDGEGSCAPKQPSPCEFLTLGIGEQRTFEYGPRSVTYRLKLLDADVVQVADPREAASDSGK